MDVNVILFASAGITALTERVVLRSREASLSDLTADVNREMLVPGLVQVRVEIPKVDNSDANKCEKFVTGRVEITNDGLCRLCSQIPVRVCKDVRGKRCRADDPPRE